jgi:hypothetical protein
MRLKGSGSFFCGATKRRWVSQPLLLVNGPGWRKFYSFQYHFAKQTCGKVENQKRRLPIGPLSRKEWLPIPEIRPTAPPSNQRSRFDAQAPLEPAWTAAQPSRQREPGTCPDQPAYAPAVNAITGDFSEEPQKLSLYLHGDPCIALLGGTVKPPFC